MNPLEVAQAYCMNAPGLREVLGLPYGSTLELEPLAQGEHNANFLVQAEGDSRTFVLRINYSSQMGLDDQIGYEYAALSALRGSGRTPRPLHVDGSKTVVDHGVLVEEYLPGDLLDLENEAQVEETARVLADIHAVPVSTSCELLRPPNQLQAQLDTARGMFENYKASAFAEPPVVQRVEGLFTQAQAALKARGADDVVSAVSTASTAAAAPIVSVVNTEAVPSHFLFDTTGRGAMVDWEKPILGNPAQDVAYFLSPTSTIWDSEVVFTAQQREAFVDAYRTAVDGRFPLEAFDADLPLFVMTNALIGITWSCNAWVEYHDPSRPLQNEKTRAKLGIYRERTFLDVVERLCFR